MNSHCNIFYYNKPISKFRQFFDGAFYYAVTMCMHFLFCVVFSSVLCHLPSGVALVFVA